MAFQPKRFLPNSTRLRPLWLALQVCAAIAIWAIAGSPPKAQLPLALGYLLAVWLVAWVLTLGVFVAISLTRFRTLVGVSLRASSNAMWLVPGLLLLASHSPYEVALGLGVVMLGTALLASSRAPRGASIPVKPVYDAPEDEPLLFSPPEPELFSRETLLTVTAALLVQLGIYALASRYPLLAGAAFAAMTAIWTTMSVTHGALEARTWTKVPFAARGTLATLLLTATLTAVLVQVEVVQEMPLAKVDATDAPEPPGRTSRLFERLVQVPPPIELPTPAQSPSGTVASGQKVAQMVDPAPAAEQQIPGGIPGIVLRPKDSRSQQPQITMAGLRFSFSGSQPLAIPFTGEYEVYRTSSGKLPAGASIETGTPLDRIYGTTNGSAMETVAVQSFDPPLDLSKCGRVLVALVSAEQMPLLASMQFIGEEGVEEGGTDLLGMKAVREQNLEFQVPKSARPMLVRSIRISFMRPLVDRNKNVRIEIERFTLVPRGMAGDFK